MTDRTTRAPGGPGFFVFVSAAVHFGGVVGGAVRRGTSATELLIAVDMLRELNPTGRRKVVR
jgi:hypothetical protein